MCIVSASLSNESEASGRSVKEIVESGRSVKDVYLQNGFPIAWVRNSSVLIFDYITSTFQFLKFILIMFVVA